ncbi:MarR family winged helix-turn-helix transcriptional regulator [Pseudooceanicola spongiae]|uniref:MarR family transcriptional regulator n=1 Tax=Pseudooceanicola spongiae TaxID=2613965 RepID=A0A7L9WSL2_9RHOB|nr:MarR family transcriptional regulator [Pseudooceanicola spongiae]QOL82508.1 MarR family transcriptional regulator [Pseudooceanicola spongiae]
MHHDDFQLAGFTPYLLNQAAEAQSLIFSAIYKDRYGMLRNEWRVLFHLGRYGEMTAKDISEKAMIHKTKISRAVRALEEKRFLAREVSEEDRRAERLTLRAPGREAFEYLVKAAGEYEDRLAGKLGQDEVQMLKALLNKLL